MGRIASDLAEETIRQRTEEGRFLGKFGAKFAYSIRPNQFPLFSPYPGEVRRGAEAVSRRNAIMSTLRSRMAPTDIYVKKKGPYGVFKRGYWAYRRRAGLNSDYQDLSFTGSMLEDIKVTTQVRKAGTSRGRTRFSFKFRFSMKTHGNELLRQFHEQKGKRFLGLSQNETNQILREIRGAFGGKVNRASKAAPDIFRNAR